MPPPPAPSAPQAPLRGLCLGLLLSLPLWGLLGLALFLWLHR